jgi:hypothetical protein
MTTIGNDSQFATDAGVCVGPSVTFNSEDVHKEIQGLSDRQPSSIFASLTSEVRR